MLTNDQVNRLAAEEGLKIDGCTVKEIGKNFVTVEIDPEANHGFSGMMSSCKWKKSYGPLPSIGYRMSIIHEGFGGSVRGYRKGDGTLLWFDTKEDKEKNRLKWLENYRKEKIVAFQKHKDKWIADIASLDAPFKARIQRFIDEKGLEEFLTEDGGYELFTVKQSNELYREYLTTYQSTSTYSTPEEKNEHARKWFDGFKAMSYEQQKRAFPAMDDGHSGNTFDWAVGLAKHVALGNSI